MRFQQLQIPAFGPFTQLDLQFPNSPSDLHLIYGANEAGKSSLLRAIRDLLFGIHGQSSDNFLHDYKSLRIKAQIVNQAGERLAFQRRKGNKNTLLDENDGQLPDNALSPFLGSVDQSYFSAMFGLGSAENREGATELLQGKGDMGKALFSASMGGTPIQKVIDALQADADRILRGRATTNVSLRPAITRYKELLKQSRDAMVKPEAWAKIEGDLENAESRKKQLEQDIADLDTELAWIQRCEDALPTVGRLTEELEKLSQLPRLPTLASDYRSRAESTRTKLKEAQAEAKRLDAQRSQLEAKRNDCQTSPEILAQGELLDQLHQDLSVYRERKKLLEDENAKLASLEPTLKAEMKNLQLTAELSDLEKHRLSSPVLLACQEAAEEMNQALRDQATNADKVEAQQTQIDDLEATLQALPEQNLDKLQAALAIASEATDAHKTIAATQTDEQKRARETADQHRLLSGAPDDYEETAQLPVPSLATIKRYATETDDLKREIAAEEKEERESKRRQSTIQSELNRLQRQGELPSEQALRDAREHRDRGWKLVLDEWKGDGATEELQPETPLEKAFPEAIKSADAIADQLRNDAELVAQADEKRFQLEEVEQRIQTAQERIEELQGTHAKLQESWLKEWSPCSITPGTPAEMEEWHANWREFRERIEKFNTVKDLIERKSAQIKEATRLLAAALDDSEDQEFSQLLAAARKRIQDGEQATGKRQVTQDQLDRLKRDFTKLESDQQRTEEAVEASTDKWKSQCENVGLSPDTSPSSGLQLLQDRQQLFSKFDEWQEASSRANSLTEVILQYETDVEEKAATLGLAAETTESSVSNIWNNLKEAREAQTRHKQLSEDLEQADTDLAEANRLRDQSQDELDELIQLAELQSIDQLEPLLANLEQSQALQSKIGQYRDTLSSLARGLSVDEFIAKVRAEDPNTLAGRKTTASRDKAEKQDLLSETSETLYQLLNDKKALEAASDAAADFRQQAESCAANLKQDAARFARLSLAIDRLKSQIERFRKENQGPLLQKSGDVFRQITRGSFAGLVADFNANDTPVLVGTRPDQSKVPVEGMSEGSRDQLYLALRLAALDRYLEEHEPMPLILDDLLITFDNHRTKAILPQLSELAKRTQVFLFTHHEHLIDLCTETLGEDHFKLHRLNRLETTSYE